MTAEQLLSKLIRKMSIGDTIPRGAASRVAEALGVSPATVTGWVFGARTPSPLVLPRLERFLKRARMDLAAKKSGPKSHNGRH